MKTGLLFTAAIFLIVLSAGSSAIESPVGPPTVPPSSISSGLVRSPHPVDPTSRLVVTGNVGGGRHFRGVVPYNAVSDFRGELYSTSLDSFLRRSAGSAAFGRYTGKTTPYYSHTGTVTTTRPGRPAVVNPPTVQIGRDTEVEYDLPTLLEQDRYLSDSGVSVSEFRLPFRPMSMTLEELEKIIPHKQDTYEYEPEDEESLRWQQEQQSDVQLLDQQAEPTDEGIAGISEDMITRQRTSTALSTKLFGEDVGRRLEVQADEEGADQQQRLDVYEQMRRQLEAVARTLTATRHLQRIAAEPDEQKSAFADGEDLQEDTIQFPVDVESEEYEDVERRTDRDSQGKETSMEGPSRTDLSARAKVILGKHKTFASYSRDKFNQHVRAAEAYMKRGEYYWAADAYTLASIYKYRDPLVYAGRSYALFAAGEYMSSALFLSRAIEIFPEYAGLDIDIVAIIGDRDKIENRIVDIEQWLKKSDVGELHFLLGYFYYRLGRFEPAGKAIDAAYERMPDSPAVAVLKKVIDSAGQ